MSALDNYAENSSIREMTETELDQVAGGATAIELGLAAAAAAIGIMLFTTQVLSAVGTAVAPVPVVGPIIG